MGKGKLKPCPFCGAIPKKVIFQKETYLVVAHKEHCYLFTVGGSLVTPGEIDSWNRRKGEKDAKSNPGV